MVIGYVKDKLGIGRVKYKIPDEDKNTLFEDVDTPLGLWANYLVVFFILLSIVIVFLDSVPEISIKYWYEIFIVDFIISSVFLFEYLYRWKHSSEKKKYPFRLMNVLDLLSFLPFFILICLYGIGSYSIFALFRIFRVFRIFELIEKLPIVTKLLKGLNKHKIEYLAAIFVIFIVLIIFSTLTYLSEQKWGDPHLFRSIPDTFWWAVVTMTTTGYGDAIPVSLFGKVMASMLMFVGPVLIAILSSITVIVFLDSTRIIKFNGGEIVCVKCGRRNAETSLYCATCGKKLKK